MSRTLGTVVRGVRAPIFREGDSVVDITVSTVLNALAENNITARDGDVVAVTESVVARCQGNYATVEQIAADVRAKTGGQTVGVAFPILSRNRFSLLLQGIAAGVKKVVLMLSYVINGWAAYICSALVWPALLALEYQKGRPIQRQLQLVGAAEAFHLLFVLLTVYGGMAGLSFWANLLWVLLACARGWAALSLYKMQEDDA